jgi:hypothetical protein
VEISYTFPQWTNQDKTPAALQVAWIQMISRLRLHEEGHGQHGKNAAAEIEQSHCQGDPKSITRKWAEQDKVYDTQTEQGQIQGAVLPEPVPAGPIPGFPDFSPMLFCFPASAALLPRSHCA